MARECCARCQDARWICEQHPKRPWPHDDCAGPGEPCPICNDVNPPRWTPKTGLIDIVMSHSSAQRPHEASLGR